MALSMPRNDSERLDDIRASCQRIATFGDCTSNLKSLPHEPPLLHDWLSITNLERDWLASGGIAGNFVEVLRDQFVQCGRPLADSNAAAQTGVTSGLDQHQRLGLISTATAIVLTLRFFRTLPLDRPPDIDSMKRDATGCARRGSRGCLGLKSCWPPVETPRVPLPRYLRKQCHAQSEWCQWLDQLGL